MPVWRPDCFRGSLYEPYPVPLNIVGTDSGINGSQDIDDERKGVSFVELQKKEGCGLGLTVNGGTDKGSLAQISHLRPGGIAHRSDALAVGDYIVSVNGIRTANLKHDEIINLLKNAEDMIILEIEYELPEAALNCYSMHCKCQDVTLEKEGTGFGFLLRGGMFLDTMKAHPLIVTNIRPGGPADREGSIKEGDRIIAMNGYRVTHLSLMETMTLIHQVEQEATFSVEYNVSVMEAVQNANGPLLVEIDKIPGTSLGIMLSQSSYNNKRCVCVDCVHSMSVADRSGALHEGDHILSIDGASVEHMSVAEATQLLKGTSDQIRLEILPVSHLQNQAHREYMAKTAMLPACSAATLPSISPSSSSFNGFGGGLPSLARSSLNMANHQFGTMSSRGSGRSKRNWIRPPDRKPSSCLSIASAATSVLVSNNQVCHPETTEISLYADHRGLGIQLDGGIFSTAVLVEPPLIAAIEHNSPAEKCGLLQVGDRLLCVNGMDVTDKILEEVNHMLRESRPRCVLEIEFDVTESVTMSSGTYCVRIPKPAGGLGMTINAPARRKSGDPLVITNVKKGSVAYRSGSVQPGDHLLAINDIRTETCTVDDAAHLLQTSEDIIKLKIKREDPYTVEASADSVTYTVELQRFGGPLGITISGTEDPMDNIFISDLIEGGLAERTGAIRVKDNLLAINGRSTKYKRLSEAIQMLQNAGDVVTLKVSRKISDKKSQSRRNLSANKSDLSKPPTPSMDSALESWDSSGAEMGSGHINQSKSNPVSRSKLPEKRRKSDYRPFSGESSNDAEGSGEGLADLQMSDGEWENQSDSNHSYSSSNQEDDWVGTFEDFMHGSGSEMLKQIGLSLRDRSTASLDRRSRASEPSDRYSRSKSTGRFGRSAISHDSLSLSLQNSLGNGGTNGTNGKSTSEQVQTIFTPTPIQLHRITVQKKYNKEDYGIGLSDGMYEKGVFISGVRPGSAAARAGLKAYDRILQINRTKTKDFDCRQTLPLIAESGSKLLMIICRNPLLRHRPTGCQDNSSIIAKEDRLYVNAYDTTGASDTSTKTV